MFREKSNLTVFYIFGGWWIRTVWDLKIRKDLIGKRNCTGLSKTIQPGRDGLKKYEKFWAWISCYRIIGILEAPDCRTD